MSSSSGSAIFRSARFSGESHPIASDGDPAGAAAAREAEEIIARARGEAEAIRRDAYEKGYAEGRQAGYEDGADAARSEHDQRVDEVERLRQLADAAILDRAEMLQSVEAQVVRLAIAVASRIVNREVTLDESVVLRTVRAALKTCADASTPRIRLHPLDYTFLEQNHLPDLERGSRFCELIADESIQRGGCIVECGSGAVDAQISTQLADVEAALVG